MQTVGGSVKLQLACFLTDAEAPTSCITVEVMSFSTKLIQEHFTVWCAQCSGIEAPIGFHFPTTSALIFSAPKSIQCQNCSLTHANTNQHPDVAAAAVSPHMFVFRVRPKENYNKTILISAGVNQQLKSIRRCIWPLSLDPYSGGFCELTWPNRETIDIRHVDYILFQDELGVFHPSPGNS